VKGLTANQGVNFIDEAGSGAAGVIVSGQFLINLTYLQAHH
jgi:hypothetical protein